MSRRKTIEEFKKEVYNLVGNEYTVKSDTYINARTKLLIVHNKCNYEWNVTPHNFLSGKRCPKCSGHLKLTLNNFSSYVKEVTNDEWYILKNDETSFNNNTKIGIVHRKCNHVKWITPKSFKQNGITCLWCKNLERKNHKA